MQYGDILKALRIKSGMSQESLALLLNRSRSCISKMENEQKTIDIQTFMDWIHVTGAPEVAVAMIFGLSGAEILAKILPIIMEVQHEPVRTD